MHYVPAHAQVKASYKLGEALKKPKKAPKKKVAPKKKAAGACVLRAFCVRFACV
jgi:hypothetical protein